MNLLSINEQWAVFDPCGEEKPFDAFAALRDLIAVKTYRQLIAFLKEHACNNLFVQPCKDPSQEPWNEHLIGLWFSENVDSFPLQGNLSSALDQEPDIEPFDHLVREDLKDTHAFGLKLSELSYFQKTIKNFLTLAAICNGAQAPEGFFKEIPSTVLLDEKLDSECLSIITEGTAGLFSNDTTILMADTRTLYIKCNDACMDHHGMFGDEWIDSYDSAFYPRKKYINQTVVVDNNPITVVAANYELHQDGVVYRVFSLDDCDQELLPEGFDLDEDEFAFAVTFPASIKPEKAKRLLAGRIVEALMNRGIDTLDQNHFSFANLVQDDYRQYSYSWNEGITENELHSQSTWVYELYDEAVRLTLERKVTLCTMCHTPVLIKDFRGKKIREVCSNTCKTQLSRTRREKAIALAASGAPVEYAIEQIGKEYAPSIKKWYKEAKAIAAPMAE